VITEVRTVVTGRAMRGFVDGVVSVVLARHLSLLGFSPLQIGAIVTGTLIGSSVLTLVCGFTAHRTSARTILLLATGLTAVTGIGFAAVEWFWPLLVVAVLGTLNPSSGDVSAFLPTEQSLLAAHVDDVERPRAYAIYNLAGALAGAFGALCAAVPSLLSGSMGWSERSATRGTFLVYALAAVPLLLTYRGLGDTDRASTPARPLHASRRIVLQLAALFSLDSAGSGLVAQSMLVLWLHLRFDLSAAATGGVFFAVGLVGAASQLLAAPLARRLGLVHTMVFTHLPANVLLGAAAFAPGPEVAVGLLLCRALCSSMDQPARQALVMAVVEPGERAAAASVTNVPRSLASAATPILAGYLLTQSDTGWPLVIAAVTKIAYDLLLLARFRDVVR
jgi:MFS family permease